MGRRITVVFSLILLGILIVESLAWDTLEALGLVHMPVGIIVGLFVLLVLFWMIAAIRNHSRRDK